MSEIDVSYTETHRDFPAWLLAQMDDDPEAGWDYCLSLLEDVLPYLPHTDHGYALSDLIRIEQMRREAFLANR